MPKHTQGDWYESKDRGFDIECAGKSIATCWHFDVGQSEAIANKALLAASPKMLKALEAILEDAKTNYKPEQQWPSCD